MDTQMTDKMTYLNKNRKPEKREIKADKEIKSKK